MSDTPEGAVLASQARELATQEFLNWFERYAASPGPLDLSDAPRKAFLAGWQAGRDALLAEHPLP